MTSRLKVGLAVPAGLVLCGAAFWFWHARNSLSAQQILDRMGDTYAQCRTYRDTGTMKSEYSGDPNFESGTFSTALVQPNQFRCEFKGTLHRQSKHFVIWHEGSKTSSWASPRWNGITSKTEHLTLKDALQELSPDSCNATFTISSLILSDVGKHAEVLTHLAAIERLKDEKTDEVDCYCIKGSMMPVNTMPLPFSKVDTVWIGKDDFLVRKVVETMQLSYAVTQTTTYHPTLNADVPAAALAFNAP